MLKTVSVIFLVKSTTLPPKTYCIRIHTEMTEKMVLKYLYYNTHSLVGHCLNILMLHTKGSHSATVPKYHCTTVYTTVRTVV